MQSTVKDLAVKMEGLCQQLIASTIKFFALKNDRSSPLYSILPNVYSNTQLSTQYRSKNHTLILKFQLNHKLSSPAPFSFTLHPQKKN